jgi:hypothetical protein
MPNQSSKEQGTGAESRYEKFRSELNELATTMRRDPRFGLESGALDESVRY